MHQLGARFYWPEVGRFVQQDPIGDGMNWYPYVGNNPVTGVDPEGLWWDTVIDIGLAAWDVKTAIQCPTWGNIAWAAAGVGAAAIPFVPNVLGYARHAGQAARAGRRFIGAAGEAGDAARRVFPDNIDDMSKILGQRGRAIPDTPRTPGRGKHERTPPTGKVTFEQHPYWRSNHPNTGPHWHWDEPHTNTDHGYLPGDPIPW